MGGAVWLSEDEEQAWRALQMMQAQLTAALARQLLRDARLSYAEYVVLVALTGAPEGRLRVFELAGQIGWEQSRLSHQLQRMARRGLVVKEPCSADRRGSHVAVTESGRHEIEAAAPGHVATVRRLFVDKLEPGELTAIGVAAQKVLAGLTDPTDGAGSET